jgi:hypothetical protein
MLRPSAEDSRFYFNHRRLATTGALAAVIRKAQRRAIALGQQTGRTTFKSGLSLTSLPEFRVPTSLHYESLQDFLTDSPNYIKSFVRSYDGILGLFSWRVLISISRPLGGYRSSAQFW